LGGAGFALLIIIRVVPAPTLASLLCAVLILQLSTGLATAQQNVASPPDLLEKEIAASQAAKKGAQPSVEAELLPETPKMLQAREEYTVFVWQNRRDVFAWQSASTKVIFVVVIVVVLAGLYMSRMQFSFAHNAPRLKVTKPSTEEGPRRQQPPAIRATT
jgi:hypothetical protein